MTIMASTPLKKVRILRSESDMDSHRMPIYSTKYWGILIGSLGIDKSIIRFIDEHNKVIVGIFQNKYVELI
jgi:hypothetical protein